MNRANLLGVTSPTRIEIRKIAASFLLAMTAIFMLSPFVAAMGNKNSRHREERSDLHLFLSPKNADKLPRNAGHTPIFWWAEPTLRETHVSLV